MRYAIEVKGMHCSGCQNLITLSLADVGLTDIEVDQAQNISRFSSEKSLAEVKQLLDTAFSELAAQNYSYTNLTLAA